MTTIQPPGDELKAQWQNPGDIFSLLLLVGADVIQKAIAQLVGVRFSLLWRGPTIYVTPIAFSFGWVAYAFTSLAAVLGDHRLMPAPDTDIQVVNCENGYTRTNNSWVLGRLLRDHEYRVEKAQISEEPSAESTGKVSLLIELFVAQNVDNRGPRPSATWWWSWVLIVAQQVFAAIPWIRWGYWPPFMITICGTFLAMLTAAIPQWVAEKWPGSKLRVKKDKPIALTRGNGHRYVMVIMSHDGSWDLETMASSRLNDHPSTKYVLTLVAMLWILLLLTVTGMKQHTWFLVVIGASGSIWQTYLAAKSSQAEDFDIDLKPWDNRATITGYQYSSDTKEALKQDKWKTYTETNAKEEYDNETEEPDVRDVMGALIELEKCLPKAGAALLSMFFPGGLDYEPTSLYFEREKKFWRYAKAQKAAKKTVITTAIN